jgi:hypothetical protein
MVLTLLQNYVNPYSVCQDVVTLFYENKLGMYVINFGHLAFLILIQDNYRIVVFEGSEHARSKSHATFVDVVRIAPVIDISVYTSNDALL